MRGIWMSMGTLSQETLISMSTIRHLSQDEGRANLQGNALWHVDNSSKYPRYSYSALLAHEIPEQGGATQVGIRQPLKITIVLRCQDCVRRFTTSEKRWDQRLCHFAFIVALEETCFSRVRSHGARKVGPSRRQTSTCTDRYTGSKGPSKIYRQLTHRLYTSRRMENTW